MQYINATIISFASIMMFSTSTMAKLDLPELITKQAINNIRFIDKSGQFTYYQRKSGMLLLSSNFSSNELISGIPNSNYLIHSSPSRKNIAIEKIDHFLDGNNIRQSHDLYISKFGSKSVEKIGNGVNPRLHLNDQFISYFIPRTKELIIHSLEQRSRKWTIKLLNNVNPYFSPEVIVLNEEEIIYTDINPKGYSAIVYYNTLTKKITTYLKASTPGSKIELCLNDNKLYIGQFRQIENFGESKIDYIDSKTFSLKSQPIGLYTSNLNDTGNLICTANKNSIYFIQTNQTGQRFKNDLVELDITTKNIKMITQQGDITQAINMDGRIVIPYQGKIFVATNNSVKKEEEK